MATVTIRVRPKVVNIDGLVPKDDFVRLFRFKNVDLTDGTLRGIVRQGDVIKDLDCGDMTADGLHTTCLIRIPSEDTAEFENDSSKPAYWHLILNRPVDDDRTIIKGRVSFEERVSEDV